MASTRAWLQYVASQSDVELTRAQANVTMLQAQLAAVARQVYYLSRAGEALAPINSTPVLNNEEGLATVLADKAPATSHAASAALYYYSAAWSQGFIPARQLREVTQPQIERRAQLQRARQAGDAWMGTLNPAVATLAAYGQGGVDPHTLAELLQVIGIGAIAVGVN